MAEVVYDTSSSNKSTTSLAKGTVVDGKWIRFDQQRDDHCLDPTEEISDDEEDSKQEEEEDSNNNSSSDGINIMDAAYRYNVIESLVLPVRTGNSTSNNNSSNSTQFCLLVLF
jgi:hypothetical protein